MNYLEIKCQVPRKDTAKLLHLTRDMTQEDQKEILTYIGRLEQSENKLYQAASQFVNSVTGINFRVLQHLEHRPDHTF